MLRRIRYIVTWSLVKKSAKWAATGIASVSTLMGIVGLSLVDFLPASFGWFARLLIHAEINFTDVDIGVGDLFSSVGVKVIPFDEYFDANVNDKVISRSSLNGMFIEKNLENLDFIKATIAERQQSALGEPEEECGRLRYRLGTIKSFDDYALLAFTHMDECNRAYLEPGQYEACLLNMWDELDRMYAGRRIVLPLLGAGITRFNGCARPSEDDLLRCMLCTLRASGHRFSHGILIILTKETADRMRLYEVKDYTDAWKRGMGEKDGL